MYEYEHKDEIRNTRKGCLGSSDAQLLMRIANDGFVPKSAYRRLAVVKGLVENKEIPQTAAIRTGNDIEMAIFEHLAANDQRYQSNPLLVSERYSRKNVKLISHPDIMLQDEEKQTLYVYEVKATKYVIEDTKHTYKGQMFIHLLLANELARKLGDKWRVKLFLVHYSTAGLDVENGIDFDPSRLTVSQVRISNKFFDIEKAMNIVDLFLDGFDEFYENADVEVESLPIEVKDTVKQAALILRNIEEQETAIKTLKERLYQFLVDKNIKSIKNDDFSVTRVDESESATFDYKRYLDDFEKSHPRKARKIKEEYQKKTKKKGYAKITLHDRQKD